MSSPTAALTATIAALTARLEAGISRAEEAAFRAETASLNLLRTFHVDKFNGSDDISQIGSRDAPLQTVEEAVRRTPDGGYLLVFTHAGIAMTDRVFHDLAAINIFAVDGPAGPHNMTFAAEATNLPGHFAGFHARIDSRLRFGNITMYRPGAADFASRDRLGPYVFSSAYGLSMDLIGTRLLNANGANATLISCPGRLELFGRSSEDDAGNVGAFAVGTPLYGNIVAGVDAGTPIHNGVRRFSNCPNGE